MLISVIKYIFIIICSAYTVQKLLNLQYKPSINGIILFAVYDVLLSITMYFLRQYATSVSLFVMMAVSIIVHITLYRISLSNAITSTIISYGICYLVYCLGTVIIVLIEVAFGVPPFAVECIYAVIIGIIQFILIILAFHIKRFRHGLPFLSDSKYGDLGVYLSVCILILMSFLSMDYESYVIPIVFIYCILICGMILWFWWRSRITQEYKQQLRTREINEINGTVVSLNTEIQSLQRENEELSKIIHKDNKLIPALELSVKEFLYTVAKEQDQQARISRALELITQLERISCERHGILKSYELSSKKLPSSGIPILDTLFSYMFQKATAANIDFDLSIWSDLKPMIGTVVTEQDASTVLADLIENAIIATEQCNCKKRILIGLGLLDNYYSISVSDSGVPFPNEVIENWGIKRITTHADNGGSGIGMMSTYEICKRYSASFSIETFGPDMLYSKRITICFDNANQFVSDKS